MTGNRAVTRARTFPLTIHKILLFDSMTALQARADTLSSAYNADAPFDFLKQALEEAIGEGMKPALLSAFNPEDVILSRYLAKAFPYLPVYFLETGKHFPETLRYAERVAEEYGIDSLRYLYPDGKKLEKLDASGDMWQFHTTRCCYLRKVEPLERALEDNGHDVLITGLRREQTPERDNMSAVMVDDKERLKISPLFGWSRERRDTFMEEEGIPHHPLYHLGYPSIGCAPCTTPVYPGEHERAGRWRHTRLVVEHKDDGEQTNGDSAGKTECGLHGGSI